MIDLHKIHVSNMAFSNSSSSCSLLFLIITSSLVLLHCSFHVAKADQLYYPPLAEGLSWDFYKHGCVDLELYVRQHLKNVLKDDIKLAASLLHLHFNDCYGNEGCDASVLVDESKRGSDLYKVIEDLRKLVHSKCGRVVSCADIMALIARDAVFLSGGPEYAVPLGRRDRIISTVSNIAASVNLHAPLSDTADSILKAFAAKNFSTVETVALLGGHTFGRSHCVAFTSRLYPTQDPLLENSFANSLKKICPSSNSVNTAVLDVRSPNKFDNKYYVNLLNRQGLLTLDQDLYTDRRTRGIVTGFAYDQELFFKSFVYAIVKMGQLDVLTGTQGEIRANCLAAGNSDNLILSSSMVNDKGKDLSTQ